MDRRGCKTYEAGTPASRSSWRLLQKIFPPWKQESGQLWADLKALSCPFLPWARNLIFLSPQPYRNPCEDFVLTGHVLEEENDNDCKEQLEDPHGCSWVEVPPRGGGGVKCCEEKESREMLDLYCLGWGLCNAPGEEGAVSISEEQTVVLGCARSWAREGEKEGRLNKYMGKQTNCHRKVKWKRERKGKGEGER